jgi:hypothetical protein
MWVILPIHEVTLPEVQATFIAKEHTGNIVVIP